MASGRRATADYAIFRRGRKAPMLTRRMRAGKGSRTEGEERPEFSGTAVPGTSLSAAHVVAAARTARFVFSASLAVFAALRETLLPRQRRQIGGSEPGVRPAPRRGSAEKKNATPASLVVPNDSCHTTGVGGPSVRCPHPNSLPEGEGTCSCSPNSRRIPWSGIDALPVEVEVDVSPSGLPKTNHRRPARGGGQGERASRRAGDRQFRASNAR